MHADDRWLERDGARLRWRAQGSGPALLLLHGWALDLRLWELVVQRLAARHTLVRFDRRGFGLSGGEPSLRADAADALAILDAAGIARCTVIGMSQGARVAATLARDAAERVSHVLLDGAPALEDVLDEDLEVEVPLATYQELLTQAGIAALRTALAKLPLLRLRRHSDAADALLHAMLQDYPGTDLLHHAPAVAAPARVRPRRVRSLGIAQPTLVLNGALDSAQRRRIGTALASHIPAARHALLGGAGHLACLDDPEAYCSLVGGFLAAS